MCRGVIMSWHEWNHVSTLRVHHNLSGHFPIPSTSGLNLKKRSGLFWFLSPLHARSRWNLDEARLQTLIYTCKKCESSSSTPSHSTRVHKVPYLKRDRQTDRRTDRRTSSTLYPLVYTGDNNHKRILKITFGLVFLSIIIHKYWPFLWLF